MANRINNTAGMSLVEVLVAAGIMAVVLAASASMISNQQKDIKANSEKLAALDVERLLINTLGNGKVCSSELAGTTFNAAGPYKIDSTDLAATVINLNSFHASNVVGAPTLVATNDALTDGPSGLKIDTITFKNFTTAGIADLQIADLVISLKGGIRPLKPITLKMVIETKATDPANAKAIVNCTESGKSDRSYRFAFNTTQNWTVPAGVTSAFVTMAGGGGSGAGWRVLSSVHPGHSGGFVFAHPLNLIGDETINIVVGKGGAGFRPIDTGQPSGVGSPPYSIYTNPTSDDGLGGYPGESTKIISPTLGTLLECAGGSGAHIGGVDSFNAATPAAGNVAGASAGSGRPVYGSPNRVAAGSFAQSNSPGACGLNNYGRGNPGATFWNISSGDYAGGSTPFGFGSGGSIHRSGCYVGYLVMGNCPFAADGKDGVVYIDVRY